MYSQDIITTLTNRIGYSLPLESGFAYTLSEANSVGESERSFDSFHALCTVENIFYALPDLEDSAAFNAVLDKIRKDAVLNVLPNVLDKSADYKASFDYDQTILDNINLFDECIGYKGSIMILELLLSTKESNISERNVKLSSSNLKLEINGFKGENGNNIKGLVQQYNASIKDAVKKIFPLIPTVNNGNAW